MVLFSHLYYTTRYHCHMCCRSRKLFRINAYFCFRATARHSFTAVTHPCVKQSEVAQSCPTLCDPVDCSLPGCRSHQKQKPCGKTGRGERQEGQPPIRGLGMGRATGFPAPTEPSARGPTVIWAGVGKGPSKCQTSVPRPALNHKVPRVLDEVQGK